MGGTQSTKSDAALGLNDSLQVTDKLKVTVAAIEGSPYLSNRRKWNNMSIPVDRRPVRRKPSVKNVGRNTEK